MKEITLTFQWLKRERIILNIQLPYRLIKDGINITDNLDKLLPDIVKSKLDYAYISECIDKGYRDTIVKDKISADEEVVIMVNEE